MYSLSRKSKFIITTMTIISLAVVSGCGQKTDASVVEQPTVTSVQEETGIEEDEQDEIIPEVDEEITPVIELSEEDKYPGATVVQTSDNHYTLYVDCPDNSNAHEVAQTESVRNFESFYYVTNKLGISVNFSIAITAYGIQTGAPDAFQVNFDAYKDKSITYCDPWSRSLGGEPMITAVLTDTLAQYPEEYMKYNENSDLGLVAAVILRNCLDETQNLSDAILRYLAGPEAFDQMMQAAIDETGYTREEICSNFDANFLLKYDNQNVIDHGAIDGILSYIPRNAELKIKYYNENGQVDRIDTYTVEQI